MIVVVDSITWKEAIELGHIEVEIKIRFEGVALLTAFATRNLMSLTLVVAEVQSGSGTLHGFKVTPIVA
jgi:hypothetical protein